MASVYQLANVQDFVGQEIGLSDWVEIGQERIDTFADATDDHQWIHTDPVRAAAETPFGGSIAHGFLTLSMLSKFLNEIGAVPDDSGMAVNYGMDKVRFMAPVPAGSRIRCRTVLESADSKPGNRILIRTVNRIEIEDRPRPAMTAVFLFLVGP